MGSMDRKFFVGVDEAGYGPNLGPLVVAASLWSAPADFIEQQFVDAFSHAFSTRNYSTTCEHVPLGDSKKLYSTQAGLATLEAGLLAMVATLGITHNQLGDMIQRVVSTEWIDELSTLAWYNGYIQRSLPVALFNQSEVMRLSQIACRELAKHDIELVDLRAAVVCEPRFNQAVAKWGSKGELLSRVTLELVVSLLNSCPTATEVFCDRQGGRKNYLPQLLSAMPDEWFSEIAISNDRSSYRSQGARRVDIHFSVGGDSFPPTALASMLAKYLRERLMEVLNEFWGKLLPELKPTAGYPVDALRFRQSIETIAQKLDFDVDQWWRCR